MALPEGNETSDKKSSEPHKNPDKRERLSTKVVIRRLPPNMDRETFLNQISPVPNYDYFYMVKGDASLGDNSFARAYINFTNPTDIFDFKEKFDNYVFLDNAGHEYPAVVEFAAFQKIPKRRNKVRVDPKVGTIESDPYYAEFVEMINKPPEVDEKPEYSYQITESKNEGNEITPLLEYVKNKRVEKMRIREERREERKRKEFERKKFREDERKKRYEEKSPIKSRNLYTKVVSTKEKEVEKLKVEENDKTKSVEEKSPEKEKDEAAEKFEKPAPTSYYKNREKKYDDRKRDIKSKYPPKKEYVDKREYKRRDDYKERDYRPKYDDYKKEEPKVYPKKVKKYSEKREERKMEAQKAEQRKLEQQQQENAPKNEDNQNDKPKESPVKKSEEKSSAKDEVAQESSSKAADKETKSKDKEDQQSQRRIRNKDRPTIAIYRPGMLSKRKQGEGEGDSKDNKKE